MIVRENCRSFQMPISVLREQPASFMPWQVDATPNDV
jgi:hypothetical protein